MDISIYRGDSHTFTEVITGITDLSGYTAKMYIKTRTKTDVGEISGTINGLTIYYLALNDVTKEYTAGKYLYETKIYNASDRVATPSKGQFVVNDVLEEDPS